LLTAIVIMMALIADFFFLPPLLIKLDGIKLDGIKEGKNKLEEKIQ